MLHGRVEFRLQHRGAIAQLGERLHGMQEVGGSIPPGSTTPDLRPFGVLNNLMSLCVPIV